MSRGFCGQCGEPFDDNFGPHTCTIYYVVQEKTKHGPFKTQDEADWFRKNVLFDTTAYVKEAS